MIILTSIEEKNATNLKRVLLTVVGCVVGSLFLYLAFRGVSWNDLKTGMGQMRPFYLLPAGLFVLMCQIVRTLRFRVIISPFSDLSIRCLWDVTNIWVAANVIMPARLGELARPYLLQSRGVSFSSTFGAVMVERFFDLSGLLFLLGVVLWNSPQLPRLYTVFGGALLLLLIVGYSLVLIILNNQEKFQAVVYKLVSILPERPAAFISRFLRRLIAGLGIMASPKKALLISMYSIILWVLFSCITYTFLLAFSIEAPFLVAVTIQVLMALGIALPSAPGFIGTFHAVGRYALALFGVNAVVAVAFATAYHLFVLTTSLLLGLWSYATSDFKLYHEMFSASADEESVSKMKVDTSVS